VHFEHGGLARHKMVHKKVVCENGRNSCIYEASVRHGGYSAQLAASRVDATRLEPYHLATLEKAACQNIGMKWWLSTESL
jgi:hypothetical protein